MRFDGGVVWDVIYQNALTIRNNKHTLVLQWVPSHSKILENKKANTVAKDIAHKGDRGTDQWSLLIYIKIESQKIRVAELLKWDQAKTQKRKTTMQEFYISNIESKISLALGKTLKST